MTKTINKQWFIYIHIYMRTLCRTCTCNNHWNDIYIYFMQICSKYITEIENLICLLANRSILNGIRVRTHCVVAHHLYMPCLSFPFFFVFHLCMFLSFALCFTNQILWMKHIKKTFDLCSPTDDLLLLLLCFFLLLFFTRVSDIVIIGHKMSLNGRNGSFCFSF